MKSKRASSRSKVIVNGETLWLGKEIDEETYHFWRLEKLARFDWEWESSLKIQKRILKSPRRAEQSTDMKSMGKKERREWCFAVVMWIYDNATGTTNESTNEIVNCNVRKEWKIKIETYIMVVKTKTINYYFNWICFFLQVGKGKLKKKTWNYLEYKVLQKLNMRVMILTRGSAKYRYVISIDHMFC